MRVSWTAGAVALLLVLGGCSSEDDACPPQMGEQVACYVHLSEAVDDAYRSTFADLAMACASIARDLGGTPAEIDPSTVTEDDIAAACDAASEEMEASIEADGSVSIQILTTECSHDEATRRACDETTSDSVCHATCVAMVVVNTACTVTVEAAGNDALASTLEANLPVFLAAQEYLSQTSPQLGEAALQIADDLLAVFNQYPACREMHGAEFERARDTITRWFPAYIAVFSAFAAGFAESDASE